MPFSFRRLTKTSLLAVCLLAFVALAAVAISRQPWLAKRTPSSINLAPAVIPVVQDNPKKSPLEVELLTLRENGFEPKVITCPKGRFYLAINNQSQLREVLTFTLFDEGKKKLKEEKLTGGGKHRSNNLYDLNPGRYQLIVNEHLEWSCSLEITPK